MTDGNIPVRDSSFPIWGLTSTDLLVGLLPRSDIFLSVFIIYSEFLVVLI